MPLNVRRFFASGSLVLSGFIFNFAQTTPPETASTSTTAPIISKTSAEVMRERISKAKAFIAVKNYNAAIYEMENIRRETSDQSVHGVLNVLLMNSYLEQGDYKRAQDFLKELYNLQKSGKANPSPYYFAVAGQVVKSARNQYERYRALGLSVSDRNLPLEASVDIEKMRETLETVIEQSKVIGADKSKTTYAIPLLEEATVSRTSLARDEYDARRWKNEVGDAREQMTSSRSTVLNAVNDTPMETPSLPQENTVASNVPIVSRENPPQNKTESTPLFKPVLIETSSTKTLEIPPKPPVETVAKNNPPVVKETPNVKTDEKETSKSETQPTRIRRVENNETVAEKTPSKEAGPKETAPTETVNDGSPLQVGSLLEFATKQTKPVYPTAARTIRQSGVVKVEVLIDESGEVSEVAKASGPSMLQSAAKDAIRKWRFKPFTKDGQPTKAKGYVSFNFAL
jgi:periplasmic protein TonB